MARELLRAEDLRLEQEGTGRLNHMDISIAAGTAVGIIGLAGGGKTALAQVLCGEREPDGGMVWYGAQQAGKVLLSRLGVRICRESRLLENLTVAENLLVLGRPVGNRGICCPERKILHMCRSILMEFDMEQWMDAPVEKIPPAVQHRLLLIGAVVRRKRLVALDHIADTYTPREQAELSVCIGRLCGRGSAVVYLTGHIDQVLWEMEHITVVRDGRRVKELQRGQFSEAALRTHMYGYHASRPPEKGGRAAGEIAFTLDGVPVQEGSLLPILNTDGAVDSFWDRLCRETARPCTILSADSLTDRWIGSMTAMENLLLPISRRLSDPFWHISGSVRRVLQAECAEQMEVSPQQLDRPFSQLGRVDRFRLLLYQEQLDRPAVYVFDHVTAGADLQDREEMRRIAGTLPGIVLYISGDYGELAAFETGVLSLEDGRLMEGII